MASQHGPVDQSAHLPSANGTRGRKSITSRAAASGPDPAGDEQHSVLHASVLVLNRVYMAIHIVEVRRALVLLCRELAEVVSLEDGVFGNYDLQAWREISEFQWLLNQELTQAEGQRQTAKGLNGSTGESSDDWLRCSHFPLKAPRVIRLTRYDRVPRFTLRFSRKNLFARDAHQCQYCGDTPGASQLSFDHIVPRSRGGDTNWENVVCCCCACNSRKGDRTPQEAGMSLLRVPRKPTHNPILRDKLSHPRYASWRSFLSHATPSQEAIA